MFTDPEKVLRNSLKYTAVDAYSGPAQGKMGNLPCGNRRSVISVGRVNKGVY